MSSQRAILPPFAERAYHVAMDLIPTTQAQTWGDTLAAYRDWIVIAIVVLFGLVLVQRVLAAIRRRRAPSQLHPRLARFSGKSDADLDADRKAAALIDATSSTNCIAGYELVRQVEAVFVEGYRTPEEAVIGLKAAAARLAANAIINLSQQRTGSGKCTAQGDAVVVKPRSIPTPPGGPPVQPSPST